MPQMEPPPSGAKIRMYRQGHGDCFLLCFRQSDGQPFYMLIDCGLKKGSEVVFPEPDGSQSYYDIDAIAQDIFDCTNGHLHLVVVTHEHEDHVSGFLRAKDTFNQFVIDKLWLAWTEDPKHPLANKLRKKYKDTLIGLLAVGQQLQAATASEDRQLKAVLSDLLSFETEDGELPFGAEARTRIKGITNKKAIKLLKEKANKRHGVEFLSPKDKSPRSLENVNGVRVFVLGPPEDEGLLKDMNPKGNEEFHLGAQLGQERSLFSAASHHASRLGLNTGTKEEVEANQPFSSTYRVPCSRTNRRKYKGFFDRYTQQEDWRRIDQAWLKTSEQFAIRLNNYVNNTSLVLAIELAGSEKVLLFVGDAQRGNWVSWGLQTWEVDDKEVTAEDLLARTTFYKVGHHGSHNATLKEGGLQDMAKGAYADDFVAMIPANEHWAKEVKHHPWQHPLNAIRKALYRKARGRIIQTDKSSIRKPSSRTNLISSKEWREFKKNIDITDLYFELTIQDKIS